MGVQSTRVSRSTMFTIQGVQEFNAVLVCWFRGFPSIDKGFGMGRRGLVGNLI
jgi:hypothetical protein